jgi:hypothetical protein
MDHHQRSMARARAERRSKRAGKMSSSLWGFENWANEGTEAHHVARKRYGDQLIDVPISMHRELTRRQMEEHPPDGPDLENPLERQGRLALGVADICECVGDLLRCWGETLIRAAKEGASELKDEDDAGRGGFWRRTI